MLNSGDAISPEMQQYVERVGARLASQAHRKLPYEFHYVPSSHFVNAFALPGGQIYIGAGLIALMDNEDELAAVLGHELEHVDHYHCAERVQIAARVRKLDLGIVGGIIQLPLELFEAGYSKEQELEADREGTRLAAAVNYSPYGAITLFERMRSLRARSESQARSPQGEIARVTWGTLAGYFRSHPPEDERIEAIRKLIRSEHWEARTAQIPLGVALPNEVRAP
jgi:predicted Zn-dependent protease